MGLEMLHMFKRRVLKRGLGEVGRLENAMKTRSIRIEAIIAC